MPFIPIALALGGLLILFLKHVVKGIVKLFRVAPVVASAVLGFAVVLPFSLKLINSGFFGFLGGITLLIGVVSLPIFLGFKLKERSHSGEVKAIVAALANSSHLKDFYAPERDFTNPETKAVDERTRSRVVKSFIVDATKKDTSIESYLITFRVLADPQKLQKLMSDIQHELGWAEIRKDSSFSEGGLHRVIITPSTANNPLFSAPLDAAEFYKNYPMEDRSWANIAVGLNAEAEVVHMPLSQSLFVGTSGSGKGSAVNAVLNHYLLAPEGEESFFLQGLVEIYGVDPKFTELERYSDALFLTEVEEENRSWRVAVDGNEIAGTIREVSRRMEDRILKLKGRSFTPSTQAPLLLLVIDEVLAMLQEADKETIRLLRNILVKGRSKGIFVYAYGQEVTKESMVLRDNFLSKTALRLSKQADASTLFGMDAAELSASGVHPEAIENPSSANNYKTAGLAYSFDAKTNAFSMMRFFYTSDDLIEEIRSMYTPNAADEAEYVIPEGVKL
ncbi:hypothetical protein ICM05_05305 [Leucobacter sp. cx-42]|uniref:hypothetical protein n=1 Tax=unclassified Leucobacter TaxID=2621730 RepID=UPI00165E084B|nr:MULTISPECIES: hypothetical protein [unclassified Leucobacter]MBC9954063.1 hypothetical protein [Leucobacter sp. cx-42]